MLGAVPIFTVGVAAKAGRFPEMPKLVFVIEPIAFDPAASGGSVEIEPIFQVPLCVAAKDVLEIAPMVFDPLASAGNAASDTGCVAGKLVICAREPPSPLSAG